MAGSQCMHIGLLFTITLTIHRLTSRNSAALVCMHWIIGSRDQKTVHARALFAPDWLLILPMRIRVVTCVASRSSQALHEKNKALSLDISPDIPGTVREVQSRMPTRSWWPDFTNNNEWREPIEGNYSFPFIPL